ncbi:hypothetical protein QCA50_013976 [Cerrena zonata]|uniref:Uncharacterized protein n=1 Tax=Cerrena zonata TaxID=2478898 RepID=A0AAW0FMP4_9APHY
MEYIEGELLMKQWNPLVSDEAEGAVEDLKKVIDPIVDFQDKLLSVTFNKSGSLYFFDDVDVTNQGVTPYEGEENPLLKDRWRIGPSVEKHFAKNKNKLSEKEIAQYNGPWDAEKPLDLVTSVADVELANLKNRLALAQADAGTFVAYQGAKIYNLQEDIPDYDKLDEVDKQQYQFMYYKTRNERLWEHALNDRKHDLIAVASPHIKVLKSPYVQALEFKNDKDHLYVEGSIVQLQAMWEAYVANGICNATESEFPIKYSADYLDQHQKDLEEYQMEIVSSPFAATGGWVPHDMFVQLKEQGIIVEDASGNYKIETEAALKEDPPAN